MGSITWSFQRDTCAEKLVTSSILNIDWLTSAERDDEVWTQTEITPEFESGRMSREFVAPSIFNNYQFIIYLNAS